MKHGLCHTLPSAYLRTIENLHSFFETIKVNIERNKHKV